MDARVVFDAIAASKAAWKIKPAGKKMALLLIPSPGTFISRSFSP